MYFKYHIEKFEDIYDKVLLGKSKEAPHSKLEKYEEDKDALGV